jgi:glutathione peroxidase
VARIYDFEMRRIDGQTQSLAEFRGQVLLIVNVASYCGLTPQYAELEALHRRHRDAGFSVLGFPCNQFGKQEPDADGAISQFCRTNYDVTFPMFAKVEVNGPDACPLYKYLKNARGGWLGTRAIKWNFTKFLVNHEGIVVCRYAPTARCARIERDVCSLLENATAARA